MSPRASASAAGLFYRPHRRIPIRAALPLPSAPCRFPARKRLAEARPQRWASRQEGHATPFAFAGSPALRSIRLLAPRAENWSWAEMNLGIRQKLLVQPYRAMWQA